MVSITQLTQHPNSITQWTRGRFFFLVNIFQSTHPALKRPGWVKGVLMTESAGFASQWSKTRKGMACRETMGAVLRRWMAAWKDQWKTFLGMLETLGDADMTLVKGLRAWKELEKVRSEKEWNPSQVPQATDLPPYVLGDQCLFQIYF